MTVEEKIEAALLSRVATLALSPALRVAWLNTAFTPSPPETYLRVDLFRNRNQRISIKGSNPHRRLGILQITVVSPLNAGPAAATRVAGLVAEHFPADLELTYDGVSIRIEAAPDVLSAIKQDASWDTPISVRFECFA